MAQTLISILQRLRQGYCKFKASFEHITKLCQKNKTLPKKTKQDKTKNKPQNGFGELAQWFIQAQLPAPTIPLTAVKPAPGDLCLLPAFLGTSALTYTHICVTTHTYKVKAKQNPKTLKMFLKIPLHSFL